MADDSDQNDPSTEPTIVERWLADQQAWQKTALEYLDSMVNNDEFLVHLGNAMRGSLLAGKPYPTTPPPGAAEPLSPADDRMDEILHTLHLLQGEVRDLRSAVERLQAARPTPAKAGSKRSRPRKVRRTKAAERSAAGAKDGDPG